MKYLSLLKNKKIMMGLAAGIVLVVLMINSSNKQRNLDEPDQGDLFENMAIDEEKIELDLELDKPKKIDWQIDKDISGGKADILKTDNGVIDSKKEAVFLETVGLSEKDMVSNEEGFTVYQRGEKFGAYVNKNDGYFHYTEQINEASQLISTNKVEVSLLKNRLVETVKRITGTGLEIRIEGNEFKKMVFPRWVTTNEDEAETVEIEANYYIDGEPLVNVGGEAIKAIYTRGGRLIKLEIKQAFKSINKRDEVDLVSLEDLKTRLMANFYILEAQGGESYQLSDGSEEIGTVVVNSLTRGRWFNSQRKETVPVYVIKGSAVLRTGPVKITMMTAAEK